MLGVKVKMYLKKKYRYLKNLLKCGKKESVLCYFPSLEKGS